MNHIDLSDELRQKLMESSTWVKGDFNPRLDEETEDTYSLDEETEELEESEEEYAHVCPLCAVELEEELDEETILEHLNVVLEMADRLSQLNEDTEDFEAAIQDVISSTLFVDEEDYDEE